MFIDLRWLLFAACALVLWFVCVLVNEQIGLWNISIYLMGVTLVIPALRLSFRAGLAAIALPALLMDAQMPLPFGASLFIFCLVWLLVRANVKNIRLNNFLHMTLAAQLCNLLCFVGLSLFMAENSLAYWLRALTDLALSQLLLLIVAPWFFALEKNLMRALNLDLQLPTNAQRP